MLFKTTLLSPGFSRNLFLSSILSSLLSKIQVLLSLLSLPLSFSRSPVADSDYFIFYFVYCLICYSKNKGRFEKWIESLTRVNNDEITPHSTRSPSLRRRTDLYFRLGESIVWRRKFWIVFFSAIPLKISSVFNRTCRQRNRGVSDSFKPNKWTAPTLIISYTIIIFFTVIFFTSVCRFFFVLSPITKSRTASLIGVLYVRLDGRFVVDYFLICQTSPS